MMANTMASDNIFYTTPGHVYRKNINVKKQAGWQRCTNGANISNEGEYQNNEYIKNKW